MIVKNNDDCIQILKSLCIDNMSSSMQICNSMIDCAKELFDDSETLIGLIENILKNQPSMAAVINTGIRIINAIKKGDKESIYNIKRELTNSSKSAIRSAADFLSGIKNIATISFSQSVFELVEKIKPEKVYLSLAYPAKEGEKLARLIKYMGIDPVLFEDYSYSLIMRSVDAVVVGADAIFEDGFVNKIGTFYLALLSEYFDVPFYVVGCECKYLNSDMRKFFRIIRKPEAEISNLDCERINVYFEKIPRKFVTKMFVR